LSTRKETEYAIETARILLRGSRVKNITYSKFEHFTNHAFKDMRGWEYRQVL
jgi:hypothetical protein